MKVTQYDDLKFWHCVSELQRSGTLCDVHLCVTNERGDSVICTTHKLILAALCGYFRSCLVENNFLDGYNFDGVTVEQLTLAVNYIYRQTTWQQLEGYNAVGGLISTLELHRHDSQAITAAQESQSIAEYAFKPRKKYTSKTERVVVSLETANSLYNKTKEQRKLLRQLNKMVVTTIPEPVSTIPELVSTISEQVSTIPEPVSTIFEQVSTIPEPMSTIHEQVSTIREQVSTHHAPTLSNDIPTDVTVASTEVTVTYDSNTQVVTVLDPQMNASNCSSADRMVMKRCGSRELADSSDSALTKSHAISPFPSSSKKLKVEKIDETDPRGMSGEFNCDRNVTNEFTPDLDNGDNSADDIEVNLNHECQSARVTSSESKPSTDTDTNTGVCPSNNIIKTSAVTGEKKRFIELSHTCTVCKFACFTKSGLLRHIKKAHDHCEQSHATSVNCHQCGSAFANQELYDAHCCEQHEEKHAVMFTCSMCGAQFDSESGLEDHTSASHTQWIQAAGTEPNTDEPLTCDSCAREFQTLHLLNQHMTSAHATDNKEPVVCHICDKSFDSENKLKLHFNVLHKDETVSCVLCAKEFKTYRSLKRHLTTVHSEHRPYLCEVCSATFKTKEDLKRHALLHTSNNSRLCPESDKFRRNPPGADYPCSFCGKIFKNFFHRKAHENIQHHDKTSGVTYLCTSCDKSYETRHYLNMHINNVHKAKRFVCGACNRRYQFKYELLRHQPRCHGFPEGPKPFQCNLCGTQFTIKGNLTKHSQRGCRRQNQESPSLAFVVVVDQDGENQVEIPLSQLQELGIEAEEVLSATESITSDTEVLNKAILQQQLQQTEIPVHQQYDEEVCYITEQQFEEADVKQF